MTKKKKKSPILPVVAIKATDWAGFDGQHERRDAKDFNLMPAWIVGMVVEEDNEKIVITQEHFFVDDTVRYTSVISKCSVLERVNY